MPWYFGVWGLRPQRDSKGQRPLAPAAEAIYVTDSPSACAEGPRGKKFEKWEERRIIGGTIA